MNELEKYKLEKSKQAEFCEQDFVDGFDAAMALDLAVKFAKYQNEKISEDVLLHFGYYPTLENLYQYWIDNIYKSE